MVQVSFTSETMAGSNTIEKRFRQDLNFGVHRSIDVSLGVIFLTKRMISLLASGSGIQY